MLKTIDGIHLDNGRVGLGFIGGMSVFDLGELGIVRTYHLVVGFILLLVILIVMQIWWNRRRQ